MDIGVRDVGVRDIWETVASCRFAKQLLIHIHIQGVSHSLSFSQSGHRQPRFFVVPQALNPPAHCENESPKSNVMSEAPGIMAVWQTLEVVAVGYTHTSAGVAQVA